MGNDAELLGQSKTKSSATGKEIKVKVNPQGCVYFEPSTGYYYVLDKESADAIENDNNKSQALLEAQINAIHKFEEIKEQCLLYPKDRALLSKYTTLENEVFTANQKLNEHLNYLQPLNKNDDDNKTHSLSNIGKNTEKLSELLPVSRSTGKIIYVRPSLNKKDWQPYKPEQSVSGRKSFIKNGKIDADELKKQFSSVSIKIKKDWKIIDPDKHTGALTKWADEWNGFNNWNMHDKEEQSDDDCFDASIGAQVLRYTAGVGARAEAGISLPKKNVTAQAKISGNAAFALWEGKANLKMMIPHRRGWLISLPKKQTKDSKDNDEECYLGMIRIDLEISATTSVAASLTLELGVSINSEPNKPQLIKGATPAKDSAPPANKKINIAKVVENSGVNGSFRAFSGIEAKGTLSGSIMWKNPEMMISGEYEPIAIMSLSGSLLAGVGAEYVFKIFIDDGKLFVTLHAMLCWGEGAGGAVTYEVDAIRLTSFIKYFCYMLWDADFQKLARVIAEDAFKALCNAMLLLIVDGGTMLTTLSTKLNKVAANISDYFVEKENRVNFIVKLSSNKDLCRYSSPEVKGNMLAMLTEADFIDAIIDMIKDNHINLKQCVMNIFRWVQSKSEYRNVIQHCSLTLGERKYPDWESKNNRLAAMMYFGETFDLNGKYLGDSDGHHYGGAFEAIYPKLSAEPMPGYPFMPNDSTDYEVAKNNPINKRYYQETELA